jgi:hypothetical protein
MISKNTYRLQLKCGKYDWMIVNVRVRNIIGRTADKLTENVLYSSHFHSTKGLTLITRPRDQGRIIEPLRSEALGTAANKQKIKIQGIGRKNKNVLQLRK